MAAAACALAVRPVAAAEFADMLPPVVGATELYASDIRSGLALSGYDPVSYLTDGEPHPGLAAQELISRGLVWRFASAANRAAFVLDPAAFLPRIGGYDAFSAAIGAVAASDPRYFAVSAGRLYLFRSADHRDRFEHDPAMAARAEARWPTLRAGLVKG